MNLAVDGVKGNIHSTRLIPRARPAPNVPVDRIVPSAQAAPTVMHVVPAQSSQARVVALALQGRAFEWIAAQLAQYSMAHDHVPATPSQLLLRAARAALCKFHIDHLTH